MKLKLFGICVFITALFALMAFPVRVAFAKTMPVILLSGKTEGQEIVVTATLKNNDGISAMLLSLKYDTDKLTLTGCERDENSALAGLEMTRGGNFGDYPFKIMWDGEENDESNGKLLTLRFKVKENAEGSATVMFSYDRDKDVNYYVNGDVETRNIMIDTLRLELAAGETTAIESEIPPDAEFDDDETNVGVIVGIVGGGVGAAALVVGIPWFIVKRK